MTCGITIIIHNYYLDTSVQTVVMHGNSVTIILATLKMFMMMMVVVATVVVSMKCFVD